MPWSWASCRNVLAALVVPYTSVTRVSGVVGAASGARAAVGAGGPDGAAGAAGATGALAGGGAVVPLAHATLDSRHPARASARCRTRRLTAVRPCDGLGPGGRGWSGQHASAVFVSRAKVT